MNGLLLRPLAPPDQPHLHNGQVVYVKRVHGDSVTYDEAMLCNVTQGPGAMGCSFSWRTEFGQYGWANAGWADVPDRVSLSRDAILKGIGLIEEWLFLPSPGHHPEEFTAWPTPQYGTEMLVNLRVPGTGEDAARLLALLEDALEELRHGARLVGSLQTPIADRRFAYLDSQGQRVVRLARDMPDECLERAVPVSGDVDLSEGEAGR